MVPKGLGTDIIEIARIEGVIERQGGTFLKKLFTEKECAYCLMFNDSARHFAGRFAAKEAVSKALGTGISEGLIWHQIEILNDKLGKPTVILHDVDFQGEILLSISHCKSFATATALALAE